MYIKYLLEHLKERGQLKDLDTDGILKGNLMKYYGSMSTTLICVFVY